MSKELFWINLILKDMIIASVVIVDYVIEFLYRVFLGSKVIYYLLWILVYLLFLKVIIRIIFSVIKILLVFSLSWMLKIIGNRFI